MTTKNLTRPNLELNPGRRCEKQVTYSLRYGMAYADKVTII
jgi:hypothetical protein